MKLKFVKDASGTSAVIDDRIVTIKHIPTAAEILSFPDKPESIKQRQQYACLELERQDKEARRIREGFGE